MYLQDASDPFLFFVHDSHAKTRHAHSCARTHTPTRDKYSSATCDVSFRSEPCQRQNRAISHSWQKDSPTMLTSDTMSMLAMSMFMPTATGAPVKEGRKQALIQRAVNKSAKPPTPL